MITASCPECKNQINLDTNPEIGQTIKCATCQTILEVIWLYPLSLDYPEYSQQSGISNLKNSDSS